MGEVFGSDVNLAASYQGPLDSVLNFPIYDALVQAFGLPGPQNMSGLVHIMDLSKQHYKVCGLARDISPFLIGHGRISLSSAISWKIKCVFLVITFFA